MSRLADPRALVRVGLRFALAAVMLALVFRFALPSEGDGMLATLMAAWTTTSSVALFWGAVAFAILGVSFGVGALRFQGLMRAAGLEIAWRPVVRAYVVAHFFNLVIPGAILGDVYRFSDARSDTGRGAQVAGVLVVERLLGLASLGMIGLAAAPAIPGGVVEDHWIGVLAGVCALFAVGPLAVLHPRINQTMRGLVSPLRHVSERLAEGGDAALVAVAAFAGRRGPLGTAFGLSLVNQGLPVLAIAALAVPLEGDVAGIWFAIIVPFVTLMSMLPISVGGTGIRESLYVLLFGAVGMPAASALALSLSVLGAALVWAAVGFVAFVLRPATGPGPAPQADSA